MQRNRSSLIVVLLILLPGLVLTQNAVTPVNSGPNPYQLVENWAKLPEGRSWGSVSAVDVDRDGKSIWVAERCGANSGCLANPNMDPILHFDEKGVVIKTFGAGQFVSPHGIFVDRDDNIWLTDYQDNANAGRGAAAAATATRGAGATAAGAAGAAGAAAAAGAGGAAGAAQGRGAAVVPNPNATLGHQIIKYDKNGKELMRLGRKGGAAPPECCYQPNDVLVAPNGTIFVVQGHGTPGVNLLFKFDSSGKLLQTLGKDGTGPGEFNQPHALAMDSQGRLFVGDRGNNRIQIFDQNLKFISEMTQFSRPSGLAIDKQDVLYSADSESGSVNRARGDWKRGIRIGRVSDGVVTAFIPDPVENATNTSAAEGVAVDAAGNIYGAEVGSRSLKKYVRK